MYLQYGSVPPRQTRSRQISVVGKIFTVGGVCAVARVGFPRGDADAFRGGLKKAYLPVYTLRRSEKNVRTERMFNIDLTWLLVSLILRP